MVYVQTKICSGGRDEQKYSLSLIKFSLSEIRYYELLFKVK